MVWEKIHYVGRELREKRTKLTLRQLAVWLDTEGITAPSTGKPYRPGGRGIASAVAMAYRQVESAFGKDEANESIAAVFTDAGGRYAYDNY